MTKQKARGAPSTIERAIGIARHQGFARLMSQMKNYFVSRFLGRFRIVRALPDFSRRRASIETLDGAVDFAYEWESLGIAIRPFQNKEEISAFFKIVERSRPRTIIEIGTGWGGTLFLFASVSNPDAVLVSLDLPPSLLGRGYPRWKDSFYKSFAMSEQVIKLVRGNSHDSATFEEVKRAIGSRQADILFIDGDHTYEGVKRDFELYSPLVRKGGLVALHDITTNLIDNEVEVPAFWNEIRKSHGDIEEIRFQRDYAGIGVIRV